MHHHSADCLHLDHDHAAIHPKTKQTQLAIAFCLIVSFASIELVIGLTCHSLALISESGHMASDSLALILALLATWMAQHPRQRTGSQRHLETWAALMNGIALSAIALWIGKEAIDHLQSPPVDIASLPMLVTACIGCVVNGANVMLLHRGSEHDLNLRGAFLHVLADTLSSIGVIIAAIAIATLHWLWADGAVSLFVAALILTSALPLVIASVRALGQFKPTSNGQA